MLWHFRANLQQGSENFAAYLWQCELEDAETAQAAHMGELCKNIVPSSIIIAGTVKILYPLLLKRLFLWDCNHSSLQMKNDQTVRRTLEGQNGWQRSSSVHGGRMAGPGCWDGAVSSGATEELPLSHAWGAAAIPVPGHASPGPDSKSQTYSNVLHCCDLPSVPGLCSLHVELGTVLGFSWVFKETRATAGCCKAVHCRNTSVLTAKSPEY